MPTSARPLLAPPGRLCLFRARAHRALDPILSVPVSFVMAIDPTLANLAKKYNCEKMICRK